MGQNQGLVSRNLKDNLIFPIYLVILRSWFGQKAPLSEPRFSGLNTYLISFILTNTVIPINCAATGTPKKQITS